MITTVSLLASSQWQGNVFNTAWEFGINFALAITLKSRPGLFTGDRTDDVWSPRGWTAWPRSAPAPWRWQSGLAPAPPACGSSLPPGSWREQTTRSSMNIRKGSAGTTRVIIKANHRFVHGVKRDSSPTHSLFQFAHLFYISTGLVGWFFLPEKV